MSAGTDFLQIAILLIEPEELTGEQVDHILEYRDDLRKILEEKLEFLKYGAEELKKARALEQELSNLPLGVLIKRYKSIGRDPDRAGEKRLIQLIIKKTEEKQLTATTRHLESIQ